MKLTDIIVSAVIKRGIVHEVRNIDTTVHFPIEYEGKEKIIKIHVRAEHMSIKVDKAEA